LILSNQAILEGDQAEEEVAVGGGHGPGLVEDRWGRWAYGP
jgi:hypothetical protein